MEMKHCHKEENFMNNSFIGLLEDWQNVRNLTKSFIKNLGDTELDKELPRNNLNTIRKQCEELLEVQACYIKALDSGVIKFDGYQDQTLKGNTSRKNLLKNCNELDSLLINKMKQIQENKTIDWFGEEKTIYYHLSAMISHESMHIGQIVAFCYSTDIQIPGDIINNMALSN